MSNVVEFRRPTAAGPAADEPDAPQVMQGAARCLDCGHEWHAVVDAGPDDDNTMRLQCPACTLTKGRFLGLFLADQGRDHWNCACGNDLFCITREGAYCPNCGRAQRWGKDS